MRVRQLGNEAKQQTPGGFTLEKPPGVISPHTSLWVEAVTNAQFIMQISRIFGIRLHFAA
jgi:hypothetical protein